METTAAPEEDGGLSTETIIVIVGAIAGSLFLLVVIMLCCVAYMYHRNSKRNEEKEEKRKPKKKDEEEYRDRIFRPVDWGNPEGPDGGHDIVDIDRILFEESASRRGSIAMRNPTFVDDDDGDNDANKLERQLSNGHAFPMSMTNGAGPPRPPNLEMLPPERRQSSKSNESSRPQSAKSPSSPTSQISILNRATWGAPDITADISRPPSEAGRSRANSNVNTISGPQNDSEVDLSVFGRANMRGSALQENTLRRSLRSRNQAIVDFYESGYSNSIGGRSAASLPMSRMDYQNDAEEEAASGLGTGGSKMLWQKRRFEMGS